MFADTSMFQPLRTTRRALLRAGVGGTLALALPITARAQSTSSDDRQNSFVVMATTIVGGGRIDPARAAQFIALNDADPANAADLDAMLAADPATVVATPADYPLVVPILQFFYLGTYADQPVADRQSFWYGLSSWQAVRYTSSTSICKRFGDWANPPTVT